MLAVAVGKADLPIADIDETVVGDGHTMRVAPEIFNDVSGPWNGRLA